MHLVLLTIGTLRGVLHCKTENTEFEDLKLPTINVNELIPNDIEIRYQINTTNLCVFMLQIFDGSKINLKNCMSNNCYFCCKILS